MGYMIALNFEDGVTWFVDCASTDTVADAAYRMGLNIPLDCRDGACGTCKLFCEAGTHDAEAASGYALACQMRPRSDLVLQIAASSEVCKTKPAPFTATIAEVRHLFETTVLFTLEVNEKLAFLPGQYVNIEVPGTGQHRSYSFSSAPGATPEFLVRNIPGGLMTGFLATAQPGMAVTFTGPVGGFYLRPVERPVLMLAGGTGLAPFLSMLDQLTSTKHPIHLVYGVTKDADLAGLDRLDAVAARIPGFTYTTCVADPASPQARHGYVTQHLDGAPAGAFDLYLCGPPPMVEAVRDHFDAAGIIPVSFRTEKFNPSGV